MKREIHEDTFVPCPYCGAPVKVETDIETGGPYSEKEAVAYALQRCTCRRAAAWRDAGCPELLEDSPCAAHKLADGLCQREAEGPQKSCTQEKCSAWHMDLYVPALAAQGYELLAAQEEQRRAWEQHRPAALLMQYIRKLPEPMRWQPVRIATGHCRFCGQARMLPTAQPDQAAADAQAAELCGCDAGQAVRRRMREKQIIREMFADMDAEAVEALQNLADLTRAGVIESGSIIKMAENVTAKLKLKDGVVIILRTEKQEHQHSL